MRRKQKSIQHGARQNSRSQNPLQRLLQSLTTEIKTPLPWRRSRLTRPLSQTLLKPQGPSDSSHKKRVLRNRPHLNCLASSMPGFLNVHRRDSPEKMMSFLRHNLECAAEPDRLLPSSAEKKRAKSHLARFCQKKSTIETECTKWSMSACMLTRNLNC